MSCWDSLNTALVHHRRFINREQAKTRDYQCIEVFYNRIRKQARLGYLSPVTFTQQYYVQQVAA